MRDIEKTLQSLEDIAIPTDLHRQIMLRVFAEKIKKPFFIFLSVLGVNLIVVGWYLVSVLLENQTFLILKSFFVDGFELSTSFAIDVLQTLALVTPFGWLIAFAASIMLLSYALYLFYDQESILYRRQLFWNKN